MLQKNNATIHLILLIIFSWTIELWNEIISRYTDRVLRLLWLFVMYLLVRHDWFPILGKKEYSKLFYLMLCPRLSVNRMQVLFNLESFKFVAERNFNYLVYTNWNVLTVVIAWICIFYINKNENKESIIVDIFPTKNYYCFSILLN